MEEERMSKGEVRMKRHDDRFFIIRDSLFAIPNS